MRRINELKKEIIKLNPLQLSFIESSLNNLTIDENELFINYINYCNSVGINCLMLAKAYDLIVKDTFREQIFFKRHNRYRYSTYEEVAASVYNSEEYMTNYMLGLALSTFLWPNHREIHVYFLQILDSLPSDNQNKYLEVGPGHGFYFMQSMKKTDFNHYSGVDISATSVDLTKRIIKSKFFGEFDNFSITESNFLTWPNDNKFDFVVMSEVLEHVERPDLFLAKIHSVLTEDGSAFITTCINAPSIDHIYLYENIEQIIKQLDDSGFTIISKLVVPYSGLSLEESMEKLLPVNIALNIKKLPV